MKLVITPTEEFALLNNEIPARVWEGTTEAGVTCRVLVAGLFVPEGVDTAEFDDDLVQRPVTILEPIDPETN